MLTYRQPLRAVDAYDKVIYTNQSQAVIWAIGPVNSKVMYFVKFCSSAIDYIKIILLLSLDVYQIK